MKQYERIRAEIDLDAFEHNMDEIERLISPGTKICAVIKADGYGHGAIPLAGILEKRESVWGYAVATAEEAELLHDSGVTKPLLILGYVFEEDIGTIVDLDIRPTVFTYESALELSKAAEAAGRTVKVHVKLDTGMGRIGFACPGKAGLNGPESTEAKNPGLIMDRTADEIERIAALPNLEIEGIFTHFAMADQKDKAFSQKQAERFFELLDMIKSRGIDIPLRHISNSAGIIDMPEYNMDMVRAGIILYGLWPSDEVRRDRIDLHPLMTLKSHVVFVKELSDGDTVSYGGTYRVKGKEKIATVPVGYGDGYPRTLSNVGYVLIHGQRAPICGRVCMDQFMVNVTDIGDVIPGDEVVLTGRQGDEQITVEELGDLSGRFNYEFACDIGKRVPRVYIRKD